MYSTEITQKQNISSFFLKKNQNMKLISQFEMGRTSTCWFDCPSIGTIKDSKFAVHGCSFFPTLSLPSSSLSSRGSNLVTKKTKTSPLSSAVAVVGRKRWMVVNCRQLKVEDEEELDAEACELVNGSQVKIGEDSDGFNAFFFQAVKNNNGAGILLLSDIFGFEDSYNRDFAYRVACNGYNVLVPDLFHGDPWSKDGSKTQLEQWIAKLDPDRIAKDIATSTQWMVDKFMAADPSKKLGLIGFCYGGGRVLEVLAKDKGSFFGTGVCFYGTRMDSSAAPNVKVPALFVTGDNDPLCPVNTVNEIRNMIGSSNSRVVVFKGRGHGFVHRPKCMEEDADAEEAFKIMRNWLHDQLLDMA